MNLNSLLGSKFIKAEKEYVFMRPNIQENTYRKQKVVQQSHTHQKQHTHTKTKRIREHIIITKIILKRRDDCSC